MLLHFTSKLLERGFQKLASRRPDSAHRCIRVGSQLCVFVFNWASNPGGLKLGGQSDTGLNLVMIQDDKPIPEILYRRLLVSLAGIQSFLHLLNGCLLCACHLESIEFVCSEAQSCPTLCDPVDCSPLGSSVHGIFQARLLEWVAISSSRVSSRSRNWCLLHLPHWQADALPLSHLGSPRYWTSLGQTGNTNHNPCLQGPSPRREVRCKGKN